MFTLVNAVALPILYIPGLLGLRFLAGGYEPLALFVVGAAVFGIVPTAAIVYLWSGDLRALASAEVGCFRHKFAAVGSVLGAVYAWPLRE